MDKQFKIGDWVTWFDLRRQFSHKCRIDHKMGRVVCIIDQLANVEVAWIKSLIQIPVSKLSYPKCKQCGKAKTHTKYEPRRNRYYATCKGCRYIPNPLTKERASERTRLGVRNRREREYMKSAGRVIMAEYSCDVKGWNRIESFIASETYKRIWQHIVTHRRNHKNKTNYYLASRLRSRIYRVMNGTLKSAPMLKMLGCSVDELRLHLQAQFNDGMSWDNYGTHWHIDHIRPCSSFDLSKPDEQAKCFHYSNLQPLEAQENWSKSSQWQGVLIRKRRGVVQDAMCR